MDSAFAGVAFAGIVFAGVVFIGIAFVGLAIAKEIHRLKLSVRNIPFNNPFVNSIFATIFYNSNINKKAPTINS
jgi:Na+/glutamate symporter